MAWPAVGMSVLVAVAYMFVSFFVISMLDIYLFMEESESLNKSDPNLFLGIAGILHSCIIVPIVEEIGFRGIFLAGLLKSRCRPWLAILISALAFGLLHYSVQFVGATVFGIIVGWLYWRTGSILPGIIIHIVNNSLSFIDVSSQSNTVLLVILVVCLLLLAYGLWWFGKKCIFADEYNQTINTNK
jgi:membrane protease YdiL (CAAX protease family)